MGKNSASALPCFEYRGNMIHNYTAVDIETTGLNPKMEKIIEVGAVRVRDGKITEKYESLVYPGRTHRCANARCGDSTASFLYRG